MYTRLKAVFLIQGILLLLTCFYAYKGGDGRVLIFMSLSLIHFYFIFCSLLQNVRKKEIYGYYDFTVVFLSLYLFLMLFIKNIYLSGILLLFQTFVVAVWMGFGIELITQNSVKTWKGIYPLAIFSIFFALFIKSIISKEFIRNAVVGIGVLGIFFLPLFYRGIKKNFFKNYGVIFNKGMILFIVLNLSLMMFYMFGPEFNIDRVGLDFPMVTTIILFFFHGYFYYLQKKNPFSFHKFLSFVLTVLLIGIPFLIMGCFNRASNEINLLCVLSLGLALFKKELGLYDSLRKGTYFRKEETLEKIRGYEKEEEYKKRVSQVLHDEILQDVLLLKRNLQDGYSLKEKEALILKIEGLIHRLRNKMDYYKPFLKEEYSLAENYINLLKTLKHRNSNEILIDFTCEKDLYLPKPYDLLVYRMIHELVTNIYKHSKGDYSLISLKVEGNQIFLTVFNEMDFIKKRGEGSGLRSIQEEINKFAGNFEMVEEEKGITFKIKIPILEEKSYHSFLNE